MTIVQTARGRRNGILFAILGAVFRDAQDAAGRVYALTRNTSENVIPMFSESSYKREFRWASVRFDFFQTNATLLQ